MDINNHELISQTLNKVTDAHSRDLLNMLINNIGEKDTEIVHLMNRVTDLELRVAEQERYTSKDCVIIENLPWKRNNQSLTDQICLLFQQYLNYTIHPRNIKACHPLANWKNDSYPPPVIVKFIYCDDKNEIYNRKSWLASQPNPVNHKPIAIKERLPANDKRIRDRANELGLISTSVNCRIKLFTKNENGLIRSVPVFSEKAVSDLASKALKKVPVTNNQPTYPNKHGNHHQFEIPKTPAAHQRLKNASQRLNFSNCKRHRSSPLDNYYSRSTNNFLKKIRKEQDYATTQRNDVEEGEIFE